VGLISATGQEAGEPFRRWPCRSGLPAHEARSTAFPPSIREVKPGLSLKLKSEAPFKAMGLF